jgi:hypothetical protein
MSRKTFYHVPPLISVETNIPKAKNFCFKKYCVDYRGFLNVVENAWAIPCRARNCAGTISPKLKNTKKALMNWRKNTSWISMWLERCNMVLNFLDGLEEQRSLSLPEFNFYKIVKRRIANLLHYKRIY